MLPSRFVASLIPFLPPSGTAGVGDAGLSRSWLALLDTKAESEGIKCKLGPNKPALSGRNLEPEGRWCSVLPISSDQPHKAIPCPPSDSCEILSKVFQRLVTGFPEKQQFGSTVPPASRGFSGSSQLLLHSRVHHHLDPVCWTEWVWGPS